jgi:hypothetical protein
MSTFKEEAKNILQVSLLFTILISAFRFYKSAAVTFYSFGVSATYVWSKILSAIGMGWVDVGVNSPSNKVTTYRAIDIANTDIVIKLFNITKNGIVSITVSTFLYTTGTVLLIFLFSKWFSCGIDLVNQSKNPALNKETELKKTMEEIEDNQNYQKSLTGKIINQFF